MNVIELNNVSKQYILHPEMSKRISLRGLFSKLFSSPLLLQKSLTEYTLPALTNISLNIKKSHSVGIIGANGSGKSTLLRLISGITQPTKGEITTYGKVAPLLSLGLGFHLELTGRENIYLTAALLGYEKGQVEKQIPSIIAFSELETFIDVPIKYYSTGMYSRLGFSIATAKGLEPDILLVDETISVGDQNFKKKSFERMKELAKKSQTTILFVSHQLDTIQQLCDDCIWLDHGKLRMFGDTKTVLKNYQTK